MTVELIEDKRTWDQFIDKNPYGTLSHKWDFLEIAKRYSGCKLHTYGVYKGDELEGIYPLFYKKTKGFKTIFSPPFRMGIPYLGFLVSREYDDLKQSKKESFLNSFLGEIEIEIRKYSPDYMLICTVPNFLDTRFFKWNNYFVAPEYTYVVNLNQSQEEMWNNLHKDVKRCVKLADNSGLELRMSDDISILHERQEKRYKEKEANFSLDLDYLKELSTAFPDNIRVHYVYNDKGEVVSGMTSQKYNGRFLVWMGIARAEEHANEFLIWKLMEMAKAEGLEKFEIAGANVRNQCQFKSRFSPSLEVWYRIYKKSIMGKAAEWTYSNIYEKTLSQRRKVMA